MKRLFAVFSKNKFIKKESMILDNKLEAIYKALDEEAYNPINHCYNYKDANQVIRKHFEELIKEKDVAKLVKNNVALHSVIDNGVINKWVSIDGENFQVYNVNLMLTPEDDGNFKYVWYQDLRK